MTDHDARAPEPNTSRTGHSVRLTSSVQRVALMFLITGDSRSRAEPDHDGVFDAFFEGVSVE